MKYSKEFKAEALKLADEVGLKTASCQLGVPYYTLSDWRHRPSGKKPEQEEKAMSEAEKNIRILELERENMELKNANNILKDAIGFFAKDRKK